MSAFEKQSVNWGEGQKAAGNSHDEPSFAALVGRGILMGTAILPALEAEAQQPVQPPAVVRQVEHEAVSYIEFARVDQVVERFNKDTHIYISKAPGKSELPISATQLSELSQALAGKPYYLVIIGDATDATYTTRGGTRMNGIEAAKSLLGQRLFDHPEFAGITDSRVSPAQKSANLFILTFNPRDWFMSTSEMYEQYGAKDEQNWNTGHRFSQIAPQQFRNAQYARGISETIKRIDEVFNANLNQAIEKETQSKTGAQLAIKGATESLSEYQTRLADLNTRFPNRTGDLLHPGDIPQVSERIEAAKRAQGIADYGTASEVGNGVSAQLLERITRLVEYPGAGTRLEGLTKDLELARKNIFATLIPGDMKEAEGLLGEAQLRWERGESGYQVSLNTVTKSIGSLKSTLAAQEQNFALDGETIRELISENSQLQKSKYASAGLKFFQSNTENLERAQKLWGDKNLTYVDVLREAQLGVGNAELAINKAEEAALQSARVWSYLYGLGAFATAIMGAAGYLVNSQVRRRGQEAREKLAKLQGAMNKKLEGLEGLERLQTRALSENGEPVTFKPKSESAECAQKARVAIEKMWLFQVVANQEITEQASALIRTGGVLSSANYIEALKVLTSKPIEFSDKNRDRVLKAFSQQRTGLAALAVPIEELQSFSRSMKEIDQEYRQLAEIATVNLELLQGSQEKIDGLVRGIEEHVKGLVVHGGTLAEYVRGDQHSKKVFDLSESVAEFVRSSNKQITELKAEQKTDPVTVCQKLENLETLLSMVHGELGVVVQKRSSAVPSIRTVEQQFSESGLHAEWVGAELEDISEKATDFLDAAIGAFRSEDYQIDNPAFEELFSTLHERIDNAVKLNGRRSGDLAEAVKEVTELITSSRQSLASKLNLEPTKILNEKGANPDTPLGEAVEEAGTLTEALNAGELKEAAQSIVEIEAALNSARTMVQNATTVVEKHAEVLRKLEAQRKSIDADLAAGSETLAAMKERYTKAALKFVDGDATQAGADDSVENNVKEIEDALKKSETTMESAANSYRKGKIIEAAKELEAVHSSYRFAELRIVEIKEKNQTLKELSAENGSRTSAANAKYEQLVKDSEGDQTVSEETINQLENDSFGLLDDLKKKAEKSPMNPYAIRQFLEKVEESLDIAERGIATDRAAYQALRERLPEINEGLTKALKLSQRVEADGIPDSRETDQAQSELELLRQEFEVLVKEFNSAKRGQWDDFARDLDRLAVGISEAHKTIHSEAKSAKEALEYVEQAARSVSSASRWSGKHGISIDGDPGLVMLKKARAFLQQGIYADASSWAEGAHNEASHAISSAEHRVQLEDERIAEEYRQEQARIRARREQEERDSYSSNSSSSSWGSFGGSSSSSSGSIFSDFGSGGSSSSFSSDSGSGGSSTSW